MKNNTEILKLKQELEEALLLLSQITDDNFDDNFSKVVKIMKHYELKKEEVKNSPQKEIFQEFAKELFPIAKLIKDSYDNLVTKKQLELELIKDELSRIQDRKKIAVYKR